MIILIASLLYSSAIGISLRKQVQTRGVHIIKQELLKCNIEELLTFVIIRIILIAH